MRQLYEKNGHINFVNVLQAHFTGLLREKKKLNVVESFSTSISRETNSMWETCYFPPMKEVN